nr:hypothetical transcript [Hymenolepis microstoma]
MPGDSKTLKLREMFRLRSSQRHRELRLQHSESSDQTIKTERTAVVNTAPAIAPQPVPIVRVQCDPSFEDEGEYERELYRVRSFKRTSKGLISLGDSFRSRSTTNCSRGFDIPRTSAIAAKISLCRGKKNSECYSEISGRKERHSTACDESPSTNVVGEHIFVNCPTASHRPSSTNSLTNIAAPVKVQILGGPTVGKTMLCRQFLTAEFMGDKTESFSEDCIERFVVIEVDGWNRSLMLIDNIREEAADEKHSLENSIAFFTPRPSLLNDEPTLRLRSASIYATKDDVTNSEITDPETLQRTQRKSSICNFKPETLVERRTFPEGVRDKMVDLIGKKVGGN